MDRKQEQQLVADKKKLKRLEKEFAISEKSVSSSTASNLAARSAAILYGKATDKELLQYKKMLDNELSSRGKLEMVALSAGRGYLAFSQRWSDEIYAEIARVPIRKLLISRYNIKEKDADMLTKYLSWLLNPMTEGEYENPNTVELVRELFDEESFDDLVSDLELMGEQDPDTDGYKETWGQYFEDSSTNPYLINAIKRLHKKNIKTPGVILLQIHVPLGKKITIHENYNTGQYPVLVDIE
jgi:hypothetical protein